MSRPLGAQGAVVSEGVAGRLSVFELEHAVRPFVATKYLKREWLMVES